MSFFHTLVAPVKAPSFRSRSRFLVFFATCLGLLILGVMSAKASPLLFSGDFETGNLSQYKKSQWRFATCCGHSVAIVKNPVRAGRFALLIENRRTDTEPGKRAELVREQQDPIGSERWYGFSVYLPEGWVNDRQPELIAQWKSKPDLHLGEGPGMTPPLAFYIFGDTLEIWTRWDPKPVTLNEGRADGLKPNGGIVTWKVPLSKGAWTDWVIHAKWSYKSDGFLQIWKDGELIVDRKGGNTYNNREGIKLHVGNYKWPWKDSNTNSRVKERVVFFDEIRIGDKNASYRDVAPDTLPFEPPTPTAPEVDVASNVVFAVNAGGKAYIDTDGIYYEADTKFKGGKQQMFGESLGIAGTEDDRLYATQREGEFSYVIPVANGNYLVTLKFAEKDALGMGQRTFDVEIEGREVISLLDLYAEARRRRAYDVTLPVQVTDGKLNIDFLRASGAAVVSAIVVENP